MKFFLEFQQKQIKGEDEVTTFEQDQITQAKRIMKPFVLRRLKVDVLGSLPKKTDYTVRIHTQETNANHVCVLLAMIVE